MVWIWWGVGLTVTTIVGAVLVRRRRELAYSVLLTFFSAYLISANILVPRIVEVDFYLFLVTVPTGSLLWPFTGQLIDMINEVYGRRRAYFTVFVAYLSNCLFVSFIKLAGAGTIRPIWSSENERFWRLYFEPAPRVFVASVASAMICLFVDIVVFDTLKRWSAQWEAKGSIWGIMRLAGLRAITSDLVNMTLDGVLFATFAFAFVLPVREMYQLVAGSVLIKLLLVVVDKPWFIAFRLLIRGVKREGVGS